MQPIVMERFKDLCGALIVFRSIIKLAELKQDDDLVWAINPCLTKQVFSALRLILFFGNETSSQVMIISIQGGNLRQTGLSRVQVAPCKTWRIDVKTVPAK